MPFRWIRSGSLKKTSKASRAPQPENIPTTPAERVGAGTAPDVFDFAAELGVTVASEEIEDASGGPCSLSSTNREFLKTFGL